MNFLLLILAILPVILICHYIYRKDKRKEPKGLLSKLFIFGILSALLTLSLTAILQLIIPFFKINIQSINNDYFLLFIYVFIGVALIEELSKFLLVYWGSYNNKNFDELYDGMVYCVYVSLGFACFENILYILGLAKESYLLGLQTALMRGIMSVPCHAFFAIFMGHFLGLAKYYQKKKNKKLERKNLLLSVLIPLLVHGLYDYVVFLGGGIYFSIVIVIVILLYIYCIYTVKKISKQNKGIIQSNYCPICGNRVDNTFCPKCGAKQN